VLAVVVSSVFMANLDLFIVNVALPAVGSSFRGTSLGTLSWVLNGYAIVFAALLVAAGRYADRIGHRPVFLAGLVAFTVASAACAAAPGIAALIGARLVQAAGAALLMPTSLALLLAATAPERRASAVRAWASVGGIAAGLGPVVGGLVVEAGWRWVFVLNLPVGIAAFVAGIKVLPGRTTGARISGASEGGPAGASAQDGLGRGPRPDLPGAVLLTAAVAVLALGLVKSATWGWADARTLGSLAAALVVAAAFLVRSARHPAPIVELPLFRIRPFAVATAALTVFTVAFAAMLLGAVLWCQDVWGYSALRTGLAIAPGPLLVPPVALRVGPAVARFGAGRVSVLGALVFGTGVAWWAAALGAHSGYAASFLPGMALTGLGTGLVLPVLTGASAAALPPPRFATGSAVTAMGRQIGSVLGVAILVSILGTPRPEQAVAAFRHGWWFMVAAVLLSAVSAIPLTRRRH
jgi:MFS family permease